ncbi:MAG: PhnD/SsuA/transferrin family substrate-binding protein, partial [Bacteroidota bacterium]
GCTYVLNLLKQKKERAADFFSKTIYTYAHDYSIQAVERKIVDGATVDGLVYEFLKINQPGRVKNVLVIGKSEEYGIPPFVVQPGMNDSLKEKLRNIMLNMHNDPEGRELLNKIMIDKFVLGNDAAYQK